MVTQVLGFHPRGRQTEYQAAWLWHGWAQAVAGIQAVGQEDAGAQALAGPPLTSQVHQQGTALQEEQPRLNWPQYGIPVLQLEG